MAADVADRPPGSLWLLGRVHALAGAGWLRRPEWIALSTLALLGTALVAWTTEDPDRRWRWIALNRAELPAVMVAYTSAVTDRGPRVGPGQRTAWVAAPLAAGRAASERFGWRGVSALAGVDTAGHAGHGGLPDATPWCSRPSLPWPPRFLGCWSCLRKSCLLRRCGKPSRSQPGRQRGGGGDWRSALWIGLAVVLLAAPLIVLWPVSSVVGRVGRLASQRRTARIDRHRCRSQAIRLDRVGAVCRPRPARALQERLLGQMRGWQAAIAAMASLEWLYRGIAALFGVFAAGLRTSPRWARAPATSDGSPWPA